MGRAFSEIIATELQGAPGFHAIPASRFHTLDRALGVRNVSAPGISSEVTQALTSGADELGYGQYTFRAGRVEAQLTIQDAGTGKIIKVVSASAPASDVLAAATGLARQVADRVSAYGTRNAQALRAYITGTESKDAAAIEVALNLAIAADPDFGAPYRLLAQVHANERDRAGAMAALNRAGERGSAISELERARMAELAAEVGGNLAARQKALAALVKLDPGDGASWRALGEVAQTRRDYPIAKQAFQKAAELEPNDVAILNMLGYAAAYAGDLKTGMDTLRRYQSMRPNEANPLDSMGDINFALGHPADAENFYLLAEKKDRNLLADIDLLKAAISRLFRGDTAGADALARQYLDARTAAKDPLTPYRQAQWMWTSGHRKEAHQQLEAFAAGAQGGPLREVASRAYAELTIWSLAMGDRAAAGHSAQQAMALAGPSSAGVATVAQFLAQPPVSSAEWVIRAEQRFSGEALAGVKDFALAFALLLNSHFQAAQLVLKQTYDSGVSTGDEGLPYLLAWAYLETDRTREAEPLLKLNPVLNAVGPGPFAAFHFPRLFYLRGLAASREGRRDEARTNYQLFLKLSGNDPLVWGEEAKAQAAIK